MNYTISIFCRAETPVSLRELAEAVSEGQFLDDPQFDPEPESAEGENAEWRSLIVHWSPGKQPITFHQHLRDEALREKKAWLMHILERSRKSKNCQRVADHIQQTVRMFEIEVDRDEMTEDTWAMLDAVEARLAKKCDGIVFTRDEGFFDQNLKHFYKL
jgi:hypothetical protein